MSPKDEISNQTPMEGITMAKRRLAWTTHAKERMQEREVKAGKS